MEFAEPQESAGSAQVAVTEVYVVECAAYPAQSLIAVADTPRAAVGPVAAWAVAVEPSSSRPTVAVSARTERERYAMSLSFAGSRTLHEPDAYRGTTVAARTAGGKTAPDPAGHQPDRNADLSPMKREWET